MLFYVGLSCFILFYVGLCWFMLSLCLFMLVYVEFMLVYLSLQDLVNLQVPSANNIDIQDIARYMYCRHMHECK